jgi:hypothetical protein
MGEETENSEEESDVILITKTQPSPTVVVIQCTV